MGDRVLIKLRGGSGYGCPCMAAVLPLVEDEMLRTGLIRRCLDVYQWAYHRGTDASAGTHDLGGVIDVAQHTLAQRRVWARYGVMMFPREHVFGWAGGEHGHGVWYGCKHQMPYTAWQVRSGLAGGDGLGSSATLKGRAWRHFERPTDTWQVCVGRAAPAKVSAAAAAPRRAALKPISVSAAVASAHTGKASPEVKVLQQLLNRSGWTRVCGYPPIPEDGVWTRRTRLVWRAFQSRGLHLRGGDADGYPGRTSISAMCRWSKEYAPAA